MKKTLKSFKEDALWAHTYDDNDQNDENIKNTGTGEGGEDTTDHHGDEPDNNPHSDQDEKHNTRESEENKDKEQNEIIIDLDSDVEYEDDATIKIDSTEEDENMDSGVEYEDDATIKIDSTEDENMDTEEDGEVSTKEMDIDEEEHTTEINQDSVNESDDEDQNYEPHESDIESSDEDDVHGEREMETETSDEMRRDKCEYEHCMEISDTDDEHGKKTTETRQTEQTEEETDDEDTQCNRDDSEFDYESSSDEDEDNINPGPSKPPNTATNQVPPESDIIRDVNYPEIYVRSLKKCTTFTSGQAYRKIHDRVYNNCHICVFCNKKVQRIDRHLEVHRDLPEYKNQDKDLLRKLGDHKNNEEVLKQKSGELILGKRPSTTLNVLDYGPCPSCLEWVYSPQIKQHYRRCSKKTKKTKETDEQINKRELSVQSQILAGHLSTEQVSSRMRNEVLPSMKNDSTGKLAKKDKLIVALGETWIVRNKGNLEKRKNYASQHSKHDGTNTVLY